MFQGTKASHYARELRSARLRGSHADAPADSVTAQIAGLELELHAALADYYEARGYRDASHANDSPHAVAFPPVLERGHPATLTVERCVGALEALAAAAAAAPADVAASAALAALGHFALGADARACDVAEHARLLERAMPSDERTAASLALGACTYGTSARALC